MITNMCLVHFLRYVRPSLILVSPLERTMQTMLHVFPDFEWQKERVVPMEIAALHALQPPSEFHSTALQL